MPPKALESFSDQVIDWIQSGAYQEPENQKKLSVLEEPKKGRKPVIGTYENRYMAESLELYFKWMKGYSIRRNQMVFRARRVGTPLGFCRVILSLIYCQVLVDDIHPTIPVSYLRFP